MNNYEAPMASAVEFETVNIIATSGWELLITWGSNIKNIESADAGLNDMYE